MYKYFDIHEEPVLESTTALLRDAANEICQETADVQCTFWQERLTGNLMKCKDPKWEHFRRYWMDSLVVEYGNMVWCTVYNSLRSKVGDKKADQKANDANFLFRKRFE